MTPIITLSQLGAFLSATREKLMDALSLFSPDQRTLTEKKEGWNPVQIVEHIGIIDNYVVNKVADMLKNAPLYPPEEEDQKLIDVMPLFKENGIIGSKITAPSNTIPTGQVNYEEGLHRLTESLNDLLAFFPELADRQTNFIIDRHPLGVDLNVCQWIHFTAVHEWAHVNQIKRIAKVKGLLAV
ncbi:DinB superfamily protein [Paenibacillus larvae subsp. larvae]|uniref:DinB superfamily protein n=1 Tax=Paenibacillus larvae subsp. larvae TaxID=147375 RepID=A0A2L1UGG7_9BACL|nr:DinB family protein [Paenibacillus larvae]AQZ45375.1 hypothetical protein B5S25_00980 [Paenibacillus larvae subsp. pulvifaciens]AVF27328.1 DinB superfamily protein [Paenibacillus larvae subsp. larvae]AVF31991.1 DinB superfamily protein [Paenibacillus larvae subsp. larvae]MBH0343405.1 hypothetical protein [Paenibacillus larvae]MCY7520624.1 DinB family protein [Paenibacillus larvae]